MTDAVMGGGQISAGHTDFEVFFRQTYAGMRARAMLLWWDREEAEDAVQEAYLEVLRYWDRVSSYDSPEAWVYKIMTQRLGRARRAWFRRRVLDVQPPPAASVEETVEIRLTLSALRVLRDRERQILVLYCLHGLSQQEIADDLSVRRVTVAVHLRNARMKLARALGLGTGDEAGGGIEWMPTPTHHTQPPLSPPGPQVDPLISLLRQAEAWLARACAGDRQHLLAQLRARAVTDHGGSECE